MVQHTRRNNRNRKVIVVSLLLAALAVAFAGCGGGGDNADGTTAANTPSPNTAKANANVAAPEGSFREAAATWERVEEARAELDRVVGENKLDEVHEAAFKVRDAVKELPGRSASLSADARQRLDSQVKQVERLAGMLDEAGDSNNAKAVHEHHQAMDEALEAIRGLYPAGVMPARPREGSGGHGMEGGRGGKNTSRNKNDNMRGMDEH